MEFIENSLKKFTYYRQGFAKEDFWIKSGLYLIILSKLHPKLFIISCEAQIPHLMHSSTGFSCKNWLKNPPTNASPAPFVSTISSRGNGGTLTPFIRLSKCITEINK